MNKLLLTIITIITFGMMPLLASQKQADNIAQISAISLYNIDKNSLQNTIKAYLKNHPDLKALKIIETLSNETYISIYEKESGKLIEGELPKQIDKYKLFKTKSFYENEEVGEIFAYYEDKELIQLNENEKKWLENNPITLSVDDKYAPMNFLNSQNKMDGLSIDYIKLMEKKIGYPIKLDNNSWPISLANAMAHKSDGIINANSTEKRDKKLIFTEPYIVVPMVLITSNSAKEYNGLSELKNKTILVKEKTVEASILPKKYPEINIKEVANYKDALTFVSTGKADGVFGHMAVLEYEKNKYLLPNIKKNFVSFNDVITKQSIGIRNTAPELKNILDKAILSISKDQKKKINDRWMKPIKKDNNRLTNSEINWLKQNPAITLAVVDNYPPYDFRDEDNKLSGFHTEITEIINRNLGISIKIKAFKSWSEAYNAALNGSVNGIYSLSWSKEREEKYFDYTSPYHFSPYYLVVKKENDKVKGLNDLSNKNVSIEIDTIFKDVVEEKVPYTNIIFAKNTKEAYEMVSSNKALATISPNINDELFKNSGLKVASEIYHKSSNIYIGINKKYPIVSSILTKGIDSISLQDITKLRQKWFTKTKAIIELNQKEKEWIEKNPEVEVIKFFDEPPFTLNTQKKSGYVYELIEYLIESAGLNIKYTNGFNSYEDMLQAIEKGEADILTSFPTSLNLSDKSNIIKSKSILKTPFVLISTSNTKKVKSLNDLFGKKVAVVKGYVQDTYLSAFPKIQKVYVNNNEEGFEAIRLGKASYYINNKANSDYILNKSFATDLKINFELPYNSFPPLSISFAMNGQKEILVSILNKALEQIPYKKIKAISDKWIISNQKDILKIPLTEKEKEFLKNHPKIVLGADENWQPFDFKDKFGKHAGFDADFLELIKEKLNIDIKVELGKWGELQEKVRNKELSGLVAPAKNKDRDSYMNFTEPYFMISQLILVRQDMPLLNSLEELSNKTLAIKDGSSNIEYLREKYPQINLKTYKSQAEIIRAVSLGEVDAGISNIGAASYEMERNFISNIKVGFEISELSGDMRFGIRKDWPELVSILQKGIDAITREETNQILNKWLKLAISANKVKTLSFNKEEKEWLNKNPAIRLAYMDYWVHNDKGENIHTEYAGLLSKYGNVNISLIKYDAWKKGFESAKKGDDVFAILNLSWSKERELNSFDYTKPYFFSAGYIIVRNSDNSIKSLEDLANKNVFLKENSITNQIIKDLKYNISPINLKSEDDIHRELSKNDSKGVALLTYVNDPDLLEKYDLKIANKFFTKYGEIHIGTSKKHKMLYSIINKIYDVIPKSELSHIQNKNYKKASKIKVNLTQKEKEFIKNNKTIKVHNEKNWPPFNYHEFGQAKGYSIELIKLVAKNTGLNIEFITGPTWDEFLQMMKKDQLDVVINIVKNEQREKYMLFTDPFLQATMGIAVHKNNNSINKFNDILNKKVAVEKGFFYHDYFNKNHKDTKLLVVDDGLQTLQSVGFRQADATIGFIPVMKYIAQKNFITDLKYFTDTSSPIMQPMPLRFSTRKDTPELLSILQKGLASITPEQLNELSNRWLGTKEDKKSIKVDLNKEQIKWLEDHKNIKFTADPDYLPYEKFDENGKYTGMVADYLKIFEDTLDIKFEKIPTTSWSESLKMAKDKKIDVLSNYTIDKNLEDIHKSTNHYISSPISIITNEHIKEGISLKDLKNKKIAVISGYGYLNNIFVKHPDLNYIAVENAKEGLRGVSLGKYDAIICSLTLAKYKIAELGLHNLHVAGQTGEIMRLGLGIRNDWPIFVDIINKVVDAIPAGTKQEINKKWLGDSFDGSKIVELTQKEQAWLDQKIPIKYVFDPDWAPFEWKNELNEHTGIIYDILRIVSDRTGIQLEAVPTETWSEAVKLAESKQIDMYGGLGENEDRKKYMNFTKNTLYKTPYVFVVHKDNEYDYFDTFNSLKHNEKIAVVDGYTIEGIMKDKQPDIKIQTVPSTMDGFKRLTNKKIDIFLVNASTAKYYLNRKGFEDLKIATKTEYHLEIKSAIRDDWPPEVISIIDKALESISEKELADIYLKWTEVTVEKKIDWTLLYQMGGLAFLAIVLVAYWNRRLKRAVDEKTNELQKLLESFDENVIASKTNKKGIIQYASKAFCEISGYTEDELIGKPQNVVRHPDTPKEVFKELWATIQSGKVWRGEIKNKKKGGGFYWVEAIISPEFDMDNNIIGYSAIRHDITSQKEVEEKTKILNEQKIELENMLEIFDENIISSKSDLEGHIISASTAFAKITGYEVDELIGLQHSAVRHPDMPKEKFEELWATIKSGKKWRGELKNKTKDGGFYWVDALIEPEFDKDGNITGYSAIRQDITARKEVEELSANLELKVEERTAELKESQQQFSSMASNVPGVIYRCKVDDDWTMLYISNEIEKLSEYPVSDFINNKVRSFADIMHKDDIEPVATLIQNQLDKGEKFLVDYRVIDNNGVIKWVRSQGNGFRTDNGDMLLDGVLFDVTEQRKLEQNLKRSVQYQTGLATASSDLLSFHSPQDNIQKAINRYLECSEVSRVYIFENFSENDKLYMRYAYEACAEGISSQIDIPELQKLDYNEGLARWKKLMQEGDSVYGKVSEFPQEEKDFFAELEILSIVCVPIEVAGKWWGFIGFDEIKYERSWFDDEIQSLETAAKMIGGYITQIQLQNEKQEASDKLEEKSKLLAENNDQLTYVSEHANLGFWNFNPKTGESFVNDIFAKMLGYEPDDLLQSGYEKKIFKPFKEDEVFWDNLIHPDDAEQTQKLLTAHINGETDLYKADYRMRRKDNTWMWSTAIGRIAEYDKDGKPIRFNGVNIDIQDAKDAEEKIKQNKLFVDTLLDSQEQMVITTDGIQIRSCNKAFLDFFDINNIDDFLADYDCICDTFEIDTTHTYLQKHMGEDSWIKYILSHENQTHKAVIKKDGYDRIFTVTAAILPLGEGNIKSAVFTDITEIENIRKNIEIILSNIMLPVLITSKKERTILYANDYASTQYETSIDKLIGSSIDNVYTSLDQKDEILNIIADQGYVENLEERYKTQTGKEFIGLLSVKPILYNGEESYIGMVVDITKQKEIEDEIREIHKLTKDSIQYAALIQHALIPEDHLMDKYFNDSFAYWQPKDIVGGDIYLFDELRNDNECLLFVIDCTGHGVPGAFVTMLVKAIERQIGAMIASDPSMDVSPAWILEYFNKTMKKLLKQENKDSISNAGFDGGIVYYNKEESLIKYAGAQTALFYLEDNELNTIKGNRHSIGYKNSDADYKFKDHTIKVKENMKFYITTDGYIDQNGGEKGFCFSKSRFKNIIMENYNKPFKEQKEIFIEKLLEYQKDNIRNDDITLVGFEIGKNEQSNLDSDTNWVI